MTFPLLIFSSTILTTKQIFSESMLCTNGRERALPSDVVQLYCLSVGTYIVINHEHITVSLQIDPLGSPGSPLLSYPQVQADCLFNSPSSSNFFAFSWRQKRNAIPQAWFGSILKIPMNLIFISPREPSFVCWKMF